MSHWSSQIKRPTPFDLTILKQSRSKIKSNLLVVVDFIDVKED